MPTSPSIQQCLPLCHNSVNSRVECCTENKMDCIKKAESEARKSFKRHIWKVSSRKQDQRLILSHTSRSSKRRSTFSGTQDSKIIFKKRRRFSTVSTPTKFLLGGSKSDPLNLRSLEDEELNKQLNEFSPVSSPLPVRRTQVQVAVPPNIYDPLNLATGEKIELILCKSRKRRRHRKSHRDDHENILEPQDLFSAEEMRNIESEMLQNTSQYLQPSSKEDLENDISLATSEESLDKTCSLLLEKDFEIEKVCVTDSGILKESKEICAQKVVVKQRHITSTIQNTHSVKFQANTKKFCYGNQITSQCNWNYDGNTGDPRIDYLSIDLFRDKNVLDIGCNVGKLTLFIAEHMHPKKITGIDIDKKLVTFAQRQLREINGNFTLDDMPQSMTFLYGPLAKLLKSKPGFSSNFPNNVIFLEANYVPVCEDYLETQKSKYDTILCLRVTKWIHLNFGDEGLKMAFKRMYAQLRMGGCLILEPQPWFTYSANKRTTPSILKTYRSLKMRPESFCDFLLSGEVGFSSCDLIGKSTNYAKGYRQNIYLLTKDYSNNGLMNDSLSPNRFHKDEWNSNLDDNYNGSFDYLDNMNDYS